MHARTSWLAPFLFAACLLCVVRAEATVVVMHGLEEMTQRSEVIAHARVLDAKVVREEGRIVTLTNIEVMDGLKGVSTGDRLTVYQVGGSLDGMRQWIEGAHEYQPGEEIVLFAVRLQERIVSYGVGVGKFRVIYDGAFRRVVEDIQGVVAMEKNDRGEVKMAAPVPREYPSLDGFKNDVRNFAAKSSLPRSLKQQKRLLRRELQIKPGTRGALKPVTGEGR